ncbi:MAG: NblA/ycf18 family protein [Leptolyngbyaceae cyanobacterium bins.349]|nr:NblA/ycf18 family protein [Leptolyngbyaceae cyanobacterium bins.349]
MNQDIELTLEQEFSLISFTDQVQRMSREQAQELLIEQYRCMMRRETTYRNLLKHEWQLDVQSITS